MMNKFLKKAAISFAAATIALTSVAFSVSANDGMGVDAMNVTVSESYGPAYIISEVGANVRVSPSTNSRILNTLGFGESVEITGYTSNGWYQVFTTDKAYGGESTGYIWSELVSTSYDQWEDNYFYYIDETGKYDKADITSAISLCYEDGRWQKFGILSDGNTIVTLDGEPLEYLGNGAWITPDRSTVYISNPNV